jgi:hypothetical protein
VNAQTSRLGRTANKARIHTMYRRRFSADFDGNGYLAQAKVKEDHKVG